jgi:hypothetical protein
MTIMVMFRGKAYAVRQARFAEAWRPCVILIGDEDDPADYLKVSLNIPEVDLNENETIVKNYSENDGVLDTLIGAGILAPTGRTVDGGFTAHPICRILIELPRFP